MTWSELTALEPELETLLEKTKAARPRRYFWNEWELIKGRLKYLVGWDAQKPELGSSEAWDIAYQRLLGAFRTGN